MLACGKAPFNEANDSETLTNIMDCKYTVLDHVDRDCSDLIKRMIIRLVSFDVDLPRIELILIDFILSEGHLAIDWTWKTSESILGYETV